MTRFTDKLLRDEDGLGVIGAKESFTSFIIDMASVDRLYCYQEQNNQKYTTKNEVILA